MVAPIFQMKERAQRGLLTCPISHSWQVAEQKLECRAVRWQRLRASHLDHFLPPPS